MDEQSSLLDRFERAAPRMGQMFRRAAAVRDLLVEVGAILGEADRHGHAVITRHGAHHQRLRSLLQTIRGQQP